MYVAKKSARVKYLGEILQQKNRYVLKLVFYLTISNKFSSITIVSIEMKVVLGVLAIKFF